MKRLHKLENNLHHVDGDTNFSAGIFVDEQRGFKYGLRRNVSGEAHEKNEQNKATE